MNTIIIHPMVVHFPIALIITAFFFATVTLFRLKKSPELRKDVYANVTLWLLAFGVLSGACAIASGYLFAPQMSGVMGQIRAIHVTYAIAAVGVSALAALTLFAAMIRRGDNRLLFGLFYLIYLCGMVLVSLTGHLGGQMVFGA